MDAKMENNKWEVKKALANEIEEKIRKAKVKVKEGKLLTREKGKGREEIWFHCDEHFSYRFFEHIKKTEADWLWMIVTLDELCILEDVETLQKISKALDTYLL